MRKSEIRYVSMFSGIEAATVAWHELGWKAVAFSDFDKFPKEVLAHHYPDVPDLGDVTKVDWNEYEGKADLVVGGSPCQSFSVAELLRRLSQRGSSLKMFPDSCRLMEGEILRPSLGRWQNAGMGSPTEFWTLSISESPKDGADSSLSDILMAIGEVPSRYYLSEKACSGILRRASRRGKVLPPLLEKALNERIQKAQMEEE